MRILIFLSVDDIPAIAMCFDFIFKFPKKAKQIGFPLCLSKPKLELRI